jgi:hypothetical protein
VPIRDQLGSHFDFCISPRAQLQGEFASSIASWEKAISLLKSYSVTSADQRLRQEYEAGLSAARASQKEPPASARLTRPSVAAKESVTSSSASVRPPPSPKTAVQPHSSAIARQPFAARASEEAERPFMFQMLRRLSDYNEGHDPDAAKMLKTPHDMEMEAAEDPDLFRETMRKVKMNASFTFQVIGAGLTSKLDNPATEKEQRETDKVCTPRQSNGAGWYWAWILPLTPRPDVFRSLPSFTLSCCG